MTSSSLRQSQWYAKASDFMDLTIDAVRSADSNNIFIAQLITPSSEVGGMGVQGYRPHPKQQSSKMREFFPLTPIKMYFYGYDDVDANSAGSEDL